MLDSAIYNGNNWPNRTSCLVDNTIILYTRDEIGRLFSHAPTFIINNQLYCGFAESPNHVVYVIVQTRAGGLPLISKNWETFKIQGEAEYFVTNFEVF